MGRFKVPAKFKKTVLPVSVRLNIIKAFKKKCAKDKVSVSSAVEELMRREVEA